jgi:uracil DNA glycosylase
MISTKDCTSDLALSLKYNKNNFENIIKYLNAQYELSKFVFNGIKIYPEKNKVFNCFNCDFTKLKVVFIGKKPFDEYSEGLAFDSSDKKIRLHPVSELFRTYIEHTFHDGFNLNHDGEFKYLVEQGVLLLNESLTSCTKKDHSELWEPFFIHVINTIQKHHTGIIFCMNEESKHLNLIDTKLNYLLTFKDPEKHVNNMGQWGFDFKQINDILIKNNGEEYKINF